jgi:uncharacterized membrane protein
MFTSYWFTVILGAFFVTLSLISAFLEFHAASFTLMVRVPSSLIVVHEVIDFQLIDSVTLQFLVLLSLREATKTSQI